MRALLDVNVIIALLDPDHSFHSRAHKWWQQHARSGWASCPITENGFVRVMSMPGYSQIVRFAPVQLIARLRAFTLETDHQFWEDDLSVRDDSVFVADRIHGGKQLTDFYLLALAAKHKGRLATFDASIPLSAATRAKTENLCVI